MNNGCGFSAKWLMVSLMLCVPCGYAETPDWLPRVASDLDQFGRLFMSAERRELIDLQRSDPALYGQRSQVDPMIETPSAAPEQEAISPTQVKLSGVLYRDDGRHMVWIDRRSVLSQDQPNVDADLRQLRPKQQSVPVYHDDQGARLKPGQVWLLEERRVEEGFQVSKPSGVGEAMPTTQEVVP